MTRLVVEAGLSRDHLVTVGQPAVYDCPGGPGTYASLGSILAARSVDCPMPKIALSATLPNTAPDIRTLLRDAGVDLSECPGGDIPLLWILNSPQGRRVVATATPVAHELDESEASNHAGNNDPNAIGAGTSPHWYADTDVLLRSAPAHKLVDGARPALVLVDPDQREIQQRGWQYLEELATTTDIFLPSRVQLSQLGRLSTHTDGAVPTAIDVAQELRARTGRTVIARLDAEGSVVLPHDGGGWRVRSRAVYVVETTGAGDSHAGAVAGVLAASNKQADLLNAVRIATAVVARTLSAPGPTGLQTHHPLTPSELDDIETVELEQQKGR